MERFISYLKSVNYISSKLSEQLVSVTKSRTLKKRDYLLKAGQTCLSFSFISSGLLRCFYYMRGNEVCSKFIKENDIVLFSDSYFHNQSNKEYIQALEDCQLFYIEYNDLQMIFSEYPEFNAVCRKQAEKNLIESEQRLFALRMKRSHERYAILMNEYPELIQRVPSKYLASYLGVTDVTLSNVKSRI